MPPHRYDVLWTQAAQSDFRHIVEFIAGRSAGTAESIRDLLFDATTTLERQPSRGRVVPELHELGFDGWRELLVSPYRIMYRIEKRRVTITIVVDARRDLKQLLLERLIEYEP